MTIRRALKAYCNCCYGKESVEKAIDDINELIEKIHTLNNYLQQQGKGCVHLRIEGLSDIILPIEDVNVAKTKSPINVYTEEQNKISAFLINKSTEDKNLGCKSLPDSCELQSEESPVPVIAQHNNNIICNTPPNESNDCQNCITSPNVFSSSQQEATCKVSSLPEIVEQLVREKSLPSSPNSPDSSNSPISLKRPRERSLSMPETICLPNGNHDGLDGRRRSAPPTPTISSILSDRYRTTSYMTLADIEKRRREIQSYYNEYMNRKALSRILSLSMDRIEEKDEQALYPSTSSTEELTSRHCGHLTD